MSQFEKTSIGLSLLGLACVVHGQTKPEPFKSVIDLSAPNSAAQSILGLSTSKLDSPSKLNDFALGLLQSGGGTINNGISLSVSLLQLYGLKYVGAADWERNSLWFRLANYTQLSAAIAEGDGKSTAGKAGFGIALPFWDDTDWRTRSSVRGEYVKGFDKAFAAMRTNVASAPSWETGKSKDQLTGWIADARNTLNAFKLLISKEAASSQIAAAALPLWNTYTDHYAAYLSDLENVKAEDFPVPGMPDQLPPTSPFYAAAQELHATQQAFGKLDQSVITQQVKDAEVDKYIAAYSTQFEKQASAYYWNRAKFDVACADSLGAADNRYQDLTGTGSKTWATLSVPLISREFKYTADDSKFVYPTLAGLTLHGGYITDQRLFKSGAFKNAGNGYEAGGRLSYGSSKMSFFLEALYTQLKAASITAKTTGDFGVEYQMSKTNWLQFSLGNDISNPTGTVFKLGYSLNFSPVRSTQLAP